MIRTRVEPGRATYVYESTAALLDLWRPAQMVKAKQELNQGTPDLVGRCYVPRAPSLSADLA